MHPGSSIFREKAGAGPGNNAMTEVTFDKQFTNFKFVTESCQNIWQKK